MVADLLFALVPGSVACLQLICIFRLAAMKLPKNISKDNSSLCYRSSDLQSDFLPNPNLNWKQMCGVQLRKKKKKKDRNQAKFSTLAILHQSVV